MTIIAPPNPPTRKIVSLVTDLEQRMRRAEAGLRAAQLKNASITGAGLNVYDDDGVLRTVLGRQEDGSYTATSVNNPNPPPVPSSAIVIPNLASLIIRHTGETASGVGWPADLDHFNTYYTPAQNPDDWTPGPTMDISFPTEVPIAPLEYTSYLVAVTAVNHSGKESEKSVPVSGDPRQVVPDDLISDIFSNLTLSENSVTEAMLQAGAVTETKIAPESVSSPTIIAGAVLGVHILADQIDGSKLTAQAITAREIAALAIVAGKIDVNAITAGTIQAGAVTAVKLEANLLLSSRVVAGSLSGNRVEMHPTLGIQAFTSGGGVRSFWLDAATGSGFFMGQIATAGTGERIVLNPGGNNPNRIQFWSNNNTFGYIDTFSEGTTAAGMTMQSSGGDTRKVGTVWLRQAYAQLGIADASLVAGSQFYAEPNFVRARSATVDLIVDQSIAPINGTRRVVLLNYDTSNQPVPNSALYYITATANQYPMMFSPPSGVGMIWDGGGYIACVNGNTTTYDRIPIEASQFRIGSDSRSKRDVSDFGWSALDAVRGNPAKKWKRHSEGVHKVPQEDPLFPQTRPRTTSRNDPWHFGPMADNLPAELVHIDPDSGMRKLDLGSMIGVLWKALEELSERLSALEEGTS